MVTLLSVYAPQSGLSDVDKDLFFDQLRAVTARIPRSELLIPCGDWNGHVGRAGTEYREVHGGMGYGRSEPDVEGEKILEYALAFDLLLGNTCFKKRDSHLITYKSGNAATQIDFILFPRAMRKLVTDVKVIPGEEVALQHQLLVCDMKFDVPPKPKRKFTPRLKVWKLTDPQRRNHFQEVFKLHVSASAGVPDHATEDIWNNLKTGLLKTTEEVCGTTRPHRWRRETWWWNEHVGEVITAKRQAFKAWKTGKGTRASYYAAKRIARRAVHHARQEADKEVYKNIDPKSSELYRLANQLRKENADVVGDKPVKNDAGEMSVSDDSKQKAWLEHYQRLLNAEFDWDPNHLSDESPVEGPPIPITIDMVKKAISQMKAGKAPGPSGIVVEMIRVAGDMGASMIRDLAAAIIRDGKVPSDWEQSFIVCLYKGKGDALERGNYRGLKLTEQVMKVLERIVDGLIRQVVSIDDSQFGFVPGRGTTDAIFVVRQLQEKYLAANKVHKKCSGLKRLTEDPDYRCTRCKGTARPLDGRPQREAQVRPDKLEVVASFCYLGDMLSAAGGCELSTTTRVKTAWKKFKELKPVLSSHHLSFKTRGRVYSTCVRSAMLHASETWPVTKPCLQRLQRNDRAMIRQICNVKPQDTATIRSIELLARLGIEDLDLILKERRLRWYGHVERSNGAVKTAFDIQVNGKRGPGRPKMTWKQLTERDRREWKLSAIDPHDRDTWRSGVRSAMRAASQLPGKGPTVVDMAPIPAR